MGNASWWFPVVDQALWTSYAPLNYVHQGVLSTPGCDRWQSAFGPKAKEGRDLFLWPYAQRENKLSISPSAAVAKQRKTKRGRCSLLSEKYKELKVQRWSSQSHLGLWSWTAHLYILHTLPEEIWWRCSVLPSSKHCFENHEASEGAVWRLHVWRGSVILGVNCCNYIFHQRLRSLATSEPRVQMTCALLSCGNGRSTSHLKGSD